MIRNHVRAMVLAMAAVLLAGGCGADAGVPNTTAATTTSGAAATTTSRDQATTSAAPATTAAEATTTSTVAPSTTTAAPLPSWWREVTSEAPLRVWVIGDSLAGPVGNALAALGRENGLLQVSVHHKGGTGLARPDFFDWPSFLSEEPPTIALDAVVVVLGANDCQELLSAEGRVPFGTAEWDDRYATLADSFVSQLLSLANRVYWVGLPAMAKADYDERVRHLNALLAQWAEANPDLEYVEAYSLFVGQDGQYAAQLPDEDGHVVTVREADGIHYSTAGAQRMARRLFETLAADWGLPGS